jgi:protein ImuA
MLSSDHPAIWRADALARVDAHVLSSTYAALDAELPGGGWPAAGLTELLQPPRPLGACHDFRLLLPTLLAPGAAAGPLVLIGAPEGLQPFAPALVAQGLPAARLLWVRAGDDKARLWACEQALRCADVPAVLAWLQRARADGLRRLHLAALDHGKPLFAFRPATAQAESSPAPLRLLVEGGETLQVRVFKRRGPPMAQPVALAAHAPPLAALLALRQPRRVPQPAANEASRDAPRPASTRPAHALDRAVTA